MTLRIVFLSLALLVFIAPAIAESRPPRLRCHAVVDGTFSDPRLSPDARWMENSSQLAAIPSFGIVLGLLPTDRAGLPLTPERQSKFVPEYAGFIRISNTAVGGRYAARMSTDGTVSVIQDGQFVTALAATRSLPCNGVHNKAWTFDLKEGEIIIQISGANSSATALYLEVE